MLTEIITPPLSFPFKTQLHTPSIEQYLNYFQFFLPDFQNQFPKKGKNLIQGLSIYWVLFLSPFWIWTGRKYLPSHYQRTEWQKYSTLSLWVWKGSRYSQSFPLSVFKFFKVQVKVTYNQDKTLLASWFCLVHEEFPSFSLFCLYSQAMQLNGSSY